MDAGRRAGWLRRVVLGAAVLTGVLFADPFQHTSRAAAPGETRALWVLRTSLTSADRIDRLVRSARAAGFNTLFLQVRARGDAFYGGGVEPRGAGVPAGFDPLAHALRAARAAGLATHVWVNVNLVASAAAPPRDPSHLVRTHPEWLMVPRELAPALAGLSPRDPRYVARLAEWTRRRSSRIEGLYASPVPVEAARYLEGIVGDLAARYPFDGLHLDYVRYPSAEFDHSPAALAAFRASVAPELGARDRARLDARLAREPLVYADNFPARWAQFRRTRLADLVARLRAAVRASRPAAIISAAVYPEQKDAVDDRLQDWPDWARRGLVDVFCPMAYTTDLDRFSLQIQTAGRLAAPRALWAGIGAYRLTPARTVEHIAAARQAGAHGVVLFSYDSLTEPPRPGALERIGRLAFAAERAAAEPR